MKQAIIVRKDLKMRCGKIAGQVAHASCRAFNKTDLISYAHWFADGETKVILKVNSENELLRIVEVCKAMNIHNYATVNDLGKTQIEAGTLTAVGIGPLKDEVIDQLVGDLKLL